MRPPAMLLAIFFLAPLAGCTESRLGAPIQITIELDREVLAQDDTVEATVTVENRGQSPYTYYHPGCPPDLLRVTVLAGGDPVALYEYGAEPMAGACAIRSETLPRGGTRAETFHWNGRTTPDAPDPHGGDRVPAGEHVVRAELATIDESNRYPAERTISVR